MPQSEDIMKRSNTSQIFADARERKKSSDMSLELFRCMIHRMEETMSERIEQLQRTAEATRNQLVKIDQTMDELQKTNEIQCLSIKDDFESSYDNPKELNQRLKNLNEKQLQARSQHHELRRRLECLEHKFNKTFWN